MHLQPRDSDRRFLLHLNELYTNSLRILIVDDSSYNIFVLEELVWSIDKDIRIDRALNGQLALTLIEERLQRDVPKKATHDLIFLDIHMPVLDGYQV